VVLVLTAANLVESSISIRSEEVVSSFTVMELQSQELVNNLSIQSLPTVVARDITFVNILVRSPMD
jgi:hypothetical protein